MLLCGNLKESLQDTVVLKEVSLQGVKKLSSYIYTGQVRLDEADGDTVLGFLLVAHLYGFEKLLNPISRNLQQRLSIKNVFKIFSRTLHLELGDLENVSYRLLEGNPGKTLENRNLRHLSGDALRRLLSRDSFYAKEIEIFYAVVRWCRERPDGTSLLPKVLEMIRLPLIATTDLVNTVMDSDLVSKDRLWEAIRIKKSCPEALNYRGKLIPDENLATAAGRALLLADKCGEDIFSARTCEVYRSVAMSPRFLLSNDVRRTVVLSEPVLINHVQFKLPEWTSFSCSYTLSISMELDESIVVINRLDKKCRSLQELYFKPRAARFLQIRVTRISEDIQVDNFGVFFTTGWGKIF